MELLWMPSVAGSLMQAQRAIFRRNTFYAQFLLLYFLHETLHGVCSQGRGGRRGFSVSRSSH